MSYPSLNELTKAIAQELQALRKADATPLLKSVRVAMVSSNTQVLNIINDIALFPTAIVTIGDGRYSEQYSRELSPSIIVVDALNASTTEQTNNMLEMMDRILAVFEPELKKCFTVNGAPFTAEGFSPLLLEDDQIGYVIELKTFQPLEINNQPKGVNHG